MATSAMEGSPNPRTIDASLAKVAVAVGLVEPDTADPVVTAVPVGPAEVAVAVAEAELVSFLY